MIAPWDNYTFRVYSDSEALDQPVHQRLHCPLTELNFDLFYLVHINSSANL